MSDDDPTRKIPAEASGAADADGTVRVLAVGQKVFSRYLLELLAGRGGMGVVWRARDEELGETVALKFLPEVVARDPVAIDELKEETRRARRLTHPNIVRIHDFLRDEILAAVSMEYVDGTTLGQLRLQQPGKIFTPENLAPLAAQLCAAIDYAHNTAKVVHRDLKPANLLVTRDGELKVTDFGIARSLTETHTRLTGKATGGTSGTLLYMSPQQLLGQKPTAADDIYALGATLCELLTSKPPFHRGDSQTLMLQIREKPPLALAEQRAELGLSGGQIPGEWEETIAACLAKDPERRPRSALEVAQRLGLEELLPAVRSAGGSRRSLSGRQTPAAVPPVVAAVPAPMAALPPSAPRGIVPAPPPAAALPPSAPRGAVAASAPVAALPPSAPRGMMAGESPRRRVVPWVVILALLGIIGLGGWYFGFNLRESGQKVTPLADVRGGVIVRTEPSGAEVRVGAVAVENSPLTLKEQKPGRYPVHIRLARYNDWDGEVVVRQNEFAEVNVKLVRSTGTLDLSSEPSALPYEIKGEVTKQGTTPGKEVVPTGSYTIAFKREGWEEQTQTVEVAAGATQEVTAAFAPGTLIVTSEPAGAAVYEDGNEVGRTPWKKEEAPGEYAIELRLDGYQSAELSGKVRAGEETTLTATLETTGGAKPGLAWTVPDLGIELVPIEAGTFTMGSPADEPDRDTDEGPQTKVTISKAFWLGKNEVTQSQWQAIMETTVAQQRDKADKNAELHGEGPEYPMYFVSWNEAMEFCRKLTEREREAHRLPNGYAYTLPTEAQWEYACRAGTTGGFAGAVDDLAWYEPNSGNTAHPVGTKQSNAWGLNDMHGNVWEWCADWKAEYPGGEVTDFAGPESGENRVNRGGSWSFAAKSCRSAYRDADVPDYRYVGLGFRVALTPTPKQGSAGK